jgi:hypothetical protein
MPSTRLAAVLVAVVAAAPPARAADPAGGTVSPASPVIKWSGVANGFGENTVNSNSTGAGGPFVCQAPFCDTFTLDFQATDTLTVVAKALQSGTAFTEVMITAPDGTGYYNYGTQESAETTMAVAATPGTYVIGVSCGVCVYGAIPGEYNASARVGKAPVKGQPSPTPSPEPAPQPSEPPAAAAPPEPPAPAVEPTLTILTTKVSARRRLRVAVRAGGPLARLDAILFKGRRIVGKSKLARLDGNGRVTFKLRRAPRLGRYTVRVTGRSARGTLVSAQAPLRITR